MKKIRIRYAPSPTGYLHIGGARTALFCYLFAKHNNGNFILRIEDTDQSRNVTKGEESQIENLTWLGIIPDESPLKPDPKYAPYRQSEKIERYNEIIDKLISSDKAYKAYDTTEEILQQKDEQKEKGIYSFRYNRNWLKISQTEIDKRDAEGKYAIRLSLIKDKVYTWKDIVRGKVAVNTDDIGDFVIRKQDGFPTYNFAVVVDDHDMDISHILRGEEHITNTPKQLAIYDALSWEVPQFGHLTIITNNEGKKLSKRDTSLRQFIHQYREEGYVPQAIFNFLTLLGWTHPDAKELMSKEEIIESFDIRRLSKSSSKFDIKKMDWFAKEYLKNISNDEIRQHVDMSKRNREWSDLFLDTYKQSAHNYNEIKNALLIYEEPKKAIKITSDKVISTFKKHLLAGKFTPEYIQEAINLTKNETNLKGKELFMPIRKAATLEEHGPELAKAIYLFGEKIIKERMNYVN